MSSEKRHRERSESWGCWAKQKFSSNIFETETVPSHIIKNQWRAKPQVKSAFFHSSILSDKRKSIVTVRVTSERSAYLGMSTVFQHPEDVCALTRSRSAQHKGKKSPPQSTQTWHKPLISDKLKTWWKQRKGMQIVLLFAIAEEPIFKFLSVQQYSEKISLFVAFFVLQNSFFCLSGFPPHSRMGISSFGAIYQAIDSIIVYQGTRNCWMMHIWISVPQ